MNSAFIDKKIRASFSFYCAGGTDAAPQRPKRLSGEWAGLAQGR
jgi:hypothetical protein